MSQDQTTTIWALRKYLHKHVLVIDAVLVAAAVLLLALPLDETLQYFLVGLLAGGAVGSLIGEFAAVKDRQLLHLINEGVAAIPSQVTAHQYRRNAAAAFTLGAVMVQCLHKKPYRENEFWDVTWGTAERLRISSAFVQQLGYTTLTESHLYAMEQEVANAQDAQIAASYGLGWRLPLFRALISSDEVTSDRRQEWVSAILACLQTAAFDEQVIAYTSRVLQTMARGCDVSGWEASFSLVLLYLENCHNDTDRRIEAVVHHFKNAVSLVGADLQNAADRTLQNCITRSGYVADGTM